VVLVRSLAGDEQVTVRIVDVCGCPGNRLIDLTSGAFRRLAPLGIGVLPVTVELAGSERTLPPTDALQEGAKP
jgi:rare lipoprotein A (peptidoglycan hydrolase)